MLVLLHGDNIVASRSRLLELITQAKSQGQVVIRLAGQKLTAAELETARGSDSLFGESKLLVIEQLVAGVKSKQKTACIELLTKTQPSCILWENKSLTPAALKQFPQATIENFPIPNSLFTWLDDFGSHKPYAFKLQLLDQVLAQSEPELCLVMLARQVRLLIQIRTQEPIAAAPFVVAKLKRQAAQFSLEQLLITHQKLALIDSDSKQSPRVTNLRQELELLSLTQ